MARRRKYDQDITASLDSSDRYFTRVYPGLIKSSAYKNLSLGARQFYILCRVEACSTKGRQVLYNHGKECETQYGKNAFVFPASHAAEYGILRQNIARYIRELSAAGFVKILENNKHRKKVNVYEFCSDWKNRESQ